MGCCSTCRTTTHKVPWAPSLRYKIPFSNVNWELMFCGCFIVWYRYTDWSFINCGRLDRWGHPGTSQKVTCHGIFRVCEFWVLSLVGHIRTSQDIQKQHHIIHLGQLETFRGNHVSDPFVVAQPASHYLLIQVNSGRFRGGRVEGFDGTPLKLYYCHGQD